MGVPFSLVRAAPVLGEGHQVGAQHLQCSKVVGNVRCDDASLIVRAEGDSQETFSN